MSSLNALGLLLLLASSAPAAAFSIPDGYFACENDDDCVEVDDGCCGCMGNGRRTAIHKARGADYRALVKREFPLCACRGAESNDPSCRPDMEPRCAAGRCGLASSPTGAMRAAKLTAYELKKDCRTDAECVLVNEGCCGCPEGGQRDAILTSALPAYRSALKAKCAGVKCRGLNSTHQSCEEGVTAGCRFAARNAETGHCGFNAAPYKPAKKRGPAARGAR